MQRSVFLINLLDVNGKRSSWTQDSLLHILLLDLAVGIVLHDVAGHSCDDDVDGFVGRGVVDSENLLEDRFDTGSLMELEIEAGYFQAEIL